MELIRQLMVKYDTPNKREIYKASVDSADRLLPLLSSSSIAELDDAEKEVLFSDVYKTARDAGLNNRFRRSLIDVVYRRLYGKRYYSKPRMAGFVNAKTFRAKSLLHDADKCVSDFVAQQGTLNAKQRLFLILFHAAFESGLCFEEALDDLYKTLTESRQVLQPVGSSWIIQLSYSRQGHETNAKVGNKKVTHRIFRAGPLTLLAIEGFMKSRSIVCITQTATELLKSELAKIMSAPTIGQLNDRRFFRAIALLVSEQPGSELRSFLMHYACGDLSSASTSIECLNHINTQSFHAVTSPITELPDKRLAVDSTAVYQNKKDLPAYHSEFSKALRELFKTKDNSRLSKEQRIANIVQTIDAFIAQREESMSDAEFALIDWLKYCYEFDKSTTFATGDRDVRSVATLWLEVCSTTSVYVLDESEMTALYNELMRKKKLSDSKYVDKITDLVYFLHEQREVPLPQQLEPRDKRSAHVRSNIPAKEHIPHLLQDINDIYASESQHFRESVTVLLILITRTNIRPHEAMHLAVEDISTFDTGHIFIRNKRYFSEKTYSARRLIELDTFLLPEESRFVRQFINRRMERAGRSLSKNGSVRYERPHALLFSQIPQKDIPLNMRDISKHVTRLLSSYTGVHTPMYQLRHFAISIAVLVCFASDETAGELTPYSPEQITVIRDYFQLNDSLNVLYKLSAWAGHLEPNMTLSTYTHFTDLLLFQSVMRANIPTPLGYVKALSCVQSARIDKICAQHSLGRTPDRAQLMVLTDGILKKERGAWIAKPGNGVKKGDIDMDSLLNLKTEFDASHVCLVLEAYDKGRSIEEIRDIYNIEPKIIESVIDAARDTQERYRTKRRQSRLYTAETRNLGVPVPNANTDTMAANTIIQHMASAPMEHLSQAIRRACHTLLCASTYNHRYVSFNTKDINEVLELITTLRQFIPASRFYVEIHADKSIREECIRDYWSELLAGVGASEIKFKDGGRRQNSKGSVQLYFLSHDINENSADHVKKNGQHYASSALRYALHTLAIHSGAMRRYYDPNFEYDPDNVYKLTK
ncbi:hypothetical protein [Idiomarina aminovorans]|uniref:hypothetical protein n=1 Tax=Idiomarina aminovorans TaxID=2914829 RepID=UPI002003A67F|nr:hypothetical protein [Idiomarina sp. ATCH4]MCK7460210.1 hypothetical protein [Idiomarina sp. ATCH4]